VLVLLHVFAPALHSLSHAHGRGAGRVSGSLGARIAVTPPTVTPPTVAPTGAPAEVRVGAVPAAAELLPFAADDDCPLCDELQRTHGYTADVDLPLAAAEATLAAPRAPPCAICAAPTDARPPARAPPRLLDC